MPSLLSPDQIATYYREGYLHLPGVYSESDVERARALIAADLAGGGWAEAPYHSDDVTTDITSGYRSWRGSS